mmetsp:Transcript_18457/g.25937  ORF Transcript_18457/g.25937 Transcript_18457/m.25937 type:complete len:83 (+) Transcript_18457:254-502(+)
MISLISCVWNMRKAFPIQGREQRYVYHPIKVKNHHVHSRTQREAVSYLGNSNLSDHSEPRRDLKTRPLASYGINVVSVAFST